MTRNKTSTPHKIIYAEVAASPMMVEALFQTVNPMNWIPTTPLQRITCKAFEVLKHMMTTENAEGSGTYRWRSGSTMPPFWSCTPLQSDERNKVLRQELWLIYTQKTWLMPREVLSPKMVYNNDNFMNVSLVHGPYDHQLKEMYCLSCLICVRTARWLVKLQHSVISPHQPSLDTKSNHHYSLTY